MIALPTIDHVEVRWNKEFANSPEFEVYVDDAWEFPNPFNNWPHRELSEDGGRGKLFCAEQGDWAHFVYDATKLDQHSTSQFDGQCTGKLLLDDGTVREVFNGWSSRAGVVNAFLDPDDHIVDVTLYSGKYMGRAGIAIKLKALALHLPDGVFIVQDACDAPAVVYYPSVNPHKVEKQS
jgi:hypothetical protein